MNFQFHTFGCKVNTYDTGLIQKNLSENLPADLSVNLSENLHSQRNVNDLAQVHVLNTCAVTAEATKEAVRMIRKIKAKQPFCTVVVTGCAAQVDTQAFSELPGADLVVANSHKGLLPQILEQYFKGQHQEKVWKANIFHKSDLEMGGGIEESHTRAFVKIQDGCDQFCSYCIIPYARGKSRSLPMQALAQRINELSAQGIQEVVLTGVHIGDYADGPHGLEALLEYLLKQTQVLRFRLTSLEPIELTARLLELYQDARMCRHFHMSLQSAHSEVLAKMKRKYGQKEVIDALQTIAAKLPGSFVGADVIVGFPNESDDFFLETYRVLAEQPWTKLHVFPYSERRGTKAAVMPESVEFSQRKSRAQKLRELSRHRYQIEAQKQIGQLKKTLVLRNQTGLTRDYWPLELQGTSAAIGREVEVLMTAYQAPTPKNPDGKLLGQMQDQQQDQVLGL